MREIVYLSAVSAIYSTSQGIARVVIGPRDDMNSSSNNGNGEISKQYIYSILRELFLYDAIAMSRM